MFDLYLFVIFSVRLTCEPERPFSVVLGVLDCTSPIPSIISPFLFVSGNCGVAGLSGCAANSPVRDSLIAGAIS